MSYNKQKALVANVEAIETAIRLNATGATATDSDMERLAKYTGFGGIKEALNLGTDRPVPEEMQEPFKRLLNVIDFRACGCEIFRNSMINSIKSSVLTAFYTPKCIIDTLARQIHHTFNTHGLKMRSFLEPSAGVGGFLPVATPTAEQYAFEKDYLTGVVLTELHPEAKVIIDGFETIKDQDLQHYTFDVIASNIPFGTFGVFDYGFAKQDKTHLRALKTIHDYFFIKAIDLLNEGGILAFITTRGIADTPGNKFVREYLVSHANLISAIRLPDNLFMQTGGIEVGSDLLIFQKNSRKAAQTQREQLFLQTIKETDTAGNTTTPTNRVFTLPRSVLATESKMQKNQYGRYARKYKWQGTEEALSATLADILNVDFARHFQPALFLAKKENATQPLQFDLFGGEFIATPNQQSQQSSKPNRDKRPYTDEPKPWHKQGAMVVFEEQVGTLKGKYSYTFIPFKASSIDTRKAKEYLQLRDTYFQLFTTERDYEVEQTDMRNKLNTLYDAFVSRWGILHKRENKQLIHSDSLGIETLTIEMLANGEAVKSDIMREPVAFKKIDTSVVLSPTEALASSLNYYGRIDLDYIAQTTHQDEASIIEALQDEIFYDAATCEWEPKSKFIAGNVIAKSKRIRTAIALMDEGKMKAYAEAAAQALEASFPEPIQYEELDFNLGERWMPSSIYADFATWLFQANTRVKYIDVNDTYLIEPQEYSPIIRNTYQVRNLNGCDLLNYAMLDTVPELTKEEYRNGKWVRVPDDEAIQEAGNKIEEMRRLFNEWLDSQPIARRDELVRLYNERFNCYVRPSYDGSMQTFPGLSFEQFPYDELYPSQMNAIQMIKQNGGGVCWHEVGTGKTMIMCVAAYEMKRIGMVQKPLIIGLKANVHEIADTFRKAYPTARLLYPGKDDFTPANRQEMFSKIKNNNWDCIILTHDQFAKIPQSDRTMMRIVQQELDDVERCLRVLEKESGHRASGKMLDGLEKRKENLINKLKDMETRINERKDDMIDFHDMGIDHIFIDECHAFKNLMFQTRHSRVAGIGNTRGSQRAMNLLVAIRDIQMRTGRDLGATFLSGTVIVNALTELYVLFKYLRPRELSIQQVSCFDAWAAVFTKKASDYEIGVTGAVKRKERFRSYIKVPELAMFLREITDYRTVEMINLDVPRKNVRFLNSAPTLEQEAMIERLVKFANSGDWDELGLDAPKPDNLDKAKMLIATDVARKMALDMRLLGNKFSDDEQNKASICARTIYDYYVKSSDNKGTQFVFSDLSTYKPNEWNIYSDIKRKLVALGVPEDEIQFIQTAKSESARRMLIEKMNSGTVRVLMGSTSMLGTGVNAQQRAVAVHHLDIPWRPADLEQRNGRAVRKGNTVKLWGGNQVDVIIYGTEKTLDAYKFNLLRNKQLFINQINNGTIAVRRIDEDCMDENSGMNFAEFVAILSGNTDLLSKAKLDSKIMQLEKEQMAFNRERFRAERKMEQSRADIEAARQTLGRMEKDLQYATGYEGERVTLIPDMPMATAKEIGQRLHQIAKEHRGDQHKEIGTFIGLRLTVKSLTNLTGNFDRNAFYVEGISGLKYQCGVSGALPPSYAESALYPVATLDKLPRLIASQQERIDRLTAELPTLQEIASRRWGKANELAALKEECKALQQRIDEALKAAERGNAEQPQDEDIDKPKPNEAA